MSERTDRSDWSERRPAEGVRIIRAEEAQAALEAGEAAGRRPDDELRFGDVPPAPQGPRPRHRFPLPDSVDPASAVPRPPLAVPLHAEERGRGRRLSPAEREWADEPPESSAPAADEWDVGDRTTELTLPSDEGEPEGFDPGAASGFDPGPASGFDPGPASGFEAPSRPPAASYEEPDLSYPRIDPDLTAYPRIEPTPPPPAPPAPDEGLTVTGGGTEMPHWSDPPTGEVPRILIGDTDEDEDDLAAWQALGSKGTRWRDSSDDWEELDELEDLAGEGEPVGALNQSRSERSDLYSFDEDFERAEAERTGSVPLADFDVEPELQPVRTRGAAAPSARSRHARPSGRRIADRPPVGRGGRGDGAAGGGRDDLPTRVVVGIGLIVLLAIAYAIGANALVVLSTVVITAAGAEAYGILQRSGFRPATLLGLVGTVGVTLGAYWKGLEALPLITVLVFAGAMMWYLMRIVDARPLANVAVTTMTFVWVGVLG